MPVIESATGLWERSLLLVKVLILRMEALNLIVAGSRDVIDVVLQIGYLIGKHNKLRAVGRVSMAQTLTIPLNKTESDFHLHRVTNPTMCW